MCSKALANLGMVLSQGLANFAFRRPQMKPLPPGCILCKVHAEDSWLYANFYYKLYYDFWNSTPEISELLGMECTMALPMKSTTLTFHFEVCKNLWTTFYPQLDLVKSIELPEHSI